MDKHVIEERREKVVKYPKRGRQSRVRAHVRKGGVLLLISMVFICAADGCVGRTYSRGRAGGRWLFTGGVRLWR